MTTQGLWVLLYSRTGDNKQALALAESLGRPFEAKTLRYNRLRDLGLWLGPSFLTLDRSSRAKLSPPWPEAVISIGRWSVPVVREIKRRSGGRTRLVFLGNPRVEAVHFDLIFATRDYLQPRGPNVALLPMPIASAAPGPVAGSAPAEWAAALPRPRTLLLLGASIKYWDLTEAKVGDCVTVLARRANEAGGSLLVSGSPRTPDALMEAARAALGAAVNRWMAPSKKSGLAEMFGAADEVFVTGDSMSMITEAILAGKPVGIVQPELSAKGRRKLGPTAAGEGDTSKKRDLRRFWLGLWNKGLAGTIDRPRARVAAGTASYAALILAAVLSLAPGQDYALVGDDVVAGESQTGELLQPASVRTVLASMWSLFSAVERLADNLNRDAGALWLAAWDQETPWYVKLIAGGSSASALSPIDLTPDVIPVLGVLDDFLFLAIGTFLVVRLLPPPLMAKLRERAVSVDLPIAKRGAAVIFGMWTVATVATVIRAMGLF